MFKHLKRYIFLILLPTMGFAQPETIVTRDFETWSGAGIKAELSDNIDFTLDQEMRLLKNSSEIDKFFTDANLSYEPLKGFSIEEGYRFEREKKKDGFVTNHRFNIDLGYEHDISRFELNYRFRFQHQFTPETPITKYRFRIGSDYNIKDWKLDPSFSAEIFYSHYTEEGTQYIDEVLEPDYIVNEWQKIRLTLGTEYDIKKVGEIEVFYRYERELVKYYPKSTYILGLSFRYELKNLKKNDPQ